MFNRYKLLTSIILLLLCFARLSPVFAETRPVSLEFRPTSLGGGLHFHNFNSDRRNDSWLGYVLHNTIAVTKNIKARLQVYNASGKVKNSNGSDIETVKIVGQDLSLLAGFNWEEGMNLFVGFGLYLEDLSWPDYSRTWSGTSVHYGVGYRDEEFSFELIFQLKDPSDPGNFYEDIFEVSDDSDKMYSSTTLSVNYFF